MRRNKWLDDKKGEIIELYEDGLTQIEIADKYGVSQTAISTRLRKWGVSNPDGNRFKRVVIDKDELYDMYWNKEMHPSQIAKKYGCSKQVITNNLIAYDIPRRTKSEARIGKLNPIFDVGHTKVARKKMSDAFSSGQRTIGYSGCWGKPSLYKTPFQGVVKMRSSWEVKTADYLNDKNIKWYYEYEWLDLGDSKYLPDFYLPDLNLYIEVKGRKKAEDIKKVKTARKLNFKVLLWDGEELLRRGIINNSGDAEINRKYRNGKKGKGGTYYG
jgi:predicted DNA-binding protein YlxM (UPF0122 family)